MIHGTFKGINGKSPSITGTGTLRLCIKAGDDISVSLPPIQDVHIPQSPYNLLSPQLLISHLKSYNYYVPPFEHSNESYTFTFSPPSSNRLFKFTCPINFKELFSFYSNEGYQNFRKRLHHLSPS